jgi:hypothetical protein
VVDGIGNEVTGRGRLIAEQRGCRGTIIIGTGATSMFQDIGRGKYVRFQPGYRNEQRSVAVEIPSGSAASTRRGDIALPE